MAQPSSLSIVEGDQGGAQDSHSLVESLGAIAERLEKLADEQRTKKRLIEDRWLADLRQYRGRYSQTIEAALITAKQSRVFANITRKLTRAWQARIGDMLFPSDDKNWGIDPTPVPELAKEAEQAVREAEAAAEEATAANAQAMAAQGAGDVQGAQQAALVEQEAVARGTAAADRARRRQAEIEEAKRRSRLMEAQIEDQFRETDYNIRSRASIRDMCKLGSGIMKGPIVSERRRRRWSQATPDQPDMGMSQEQAGPQIGPGPQIGSPGGRYELADVADPRPEFTRVDPWLWYPDMSARETGESEFTFELHPLNKKQARKLAKREDFITDAVRELIREEPQHDLPDWWSALREIGDGDDAGIEARYLVWEYHGPLEKEDIQTIIAAIGDNEWLEEIAKDPLTSMNVVVWFSQGKILKFGQHPLDSGDSLYSCVPFEEDDTSVFGFGVPYLLRNSQSVQNGAWRMMMNNAGMTTGPQLFINQKAVEPADGDWKLKPNKVWLVKDGVAANQKIFEQFQIQSRQGDLERIIQINRQFADDEVSLPLIATGESHEGATVQTTAQGISILMNAANVTFREVVKNFDDFMTTPNVRRIYDWNMQHSKREDIKGDMEVDARGSSVLLVRELQTQNLLFLLREARQDPDMARYLKKENFYRTLVQTMSLRAGDLIKNDDEVADDDAKAAQEAANNKPIELQLIEAEAGHKMEALQMEWQGRTAVEGLRQETEMMRVAQQSNMKLEELDRRIEVIREQIASKERLFAGEAAMTNLETTKGGGGSL